MSPWCAATIRAKATSSPAIARSMTALAVSVPIVTLSAIMTYRCHRPAWRFNAGCVASDLVRRYGAAAKGMSRPLAPQRRRTRRSGFLAIRHGPDGGWLGGQSVA
jgi:hypothetical protein